MNHPPKKQAPMNYKTDADENVTNGWNNNFNSTYKKYNPKTDGPKLANNINQTVDSVDMTRMTGDESMEYNTGAYRMLTKQGSLMN